MTCHYQSVVKNNPVPLTTASQFCNVNCSWKIECYLDSKGNNPVEKFIESLPLDDRASLRARIDFLGEIGNRATEPFSKSYAGC
jgi:hypothetical protein